jgi:hypothetical protein
MIPFKVSTTIHQTSQQASPITTTNTNRHNINNQHIRNTNNALSISTASAPTLGNTNSNHMTRHAGINPYTHNGPSTFRLTNV